MQLHPALDPSFIGALKRHLSSSFRPSSPSSNNTLSSPSSLLNTNMAQRASWSSSSSSLPSTVLSEPATSPPQTLLLFSLLESDLQGDGVRTNHGERTFRVEREDGIRVRDVMIELERFLWRRAPRVVGNLNSYRTLSEGEDKKVGLGILGLEAISNSNSNSNSDAHFHSNSDSNSAITMVVSLEDVHGPSPDTSLSTLSSDINLNLNINTDMTKTKSKSEIKQEPEYAETVLAQWLGEKTVFAGLKCVENHDYKLVVRMVKPKKTSTSIPSRRELRTE